MLRRLLTVLIAIAVAGAAAWALWPRPVAVEEEGKSRIREVFTVSAPNSGQMLRVNLHAGDEVEKGERGDHWTGPARPQ